MATRVKEAAPRKERRSTSSSAPIDIPNRRSPKHAGAGSPCRDSSISWEKTTLNYLRPTASSTNEPNKLRKKPTSLPPVASNSLTRKKSMETNPSLTRSPSQTQRTPTSVRPTDKPLKPTSPSLKTVASQKPILDKTSRVPRNGRVQHPPLKATKTTIRREPSLNLKKTERKASPAAASIHCVTKKPAKLPCKKEDETMDEITVLEILKADGEEQSINEIEPIEYVDVEPVITGSIKLEEPMELAELKEEAKNKKDGPKEHSNNDEEEYKDGKYPQKFKENPATDDTHEQIIVEKVEQKDHDRDDEKKVRNREGGAGSEKESESAEKVKLEVREKEIGVIEPKLELEVKKVPRQQERLGKKETQAYNDVIEETASKLVEKRKNKVMALVGAFETVISLQVHA